MNIPTMLHIPTSTCPGAFRAPAGPRVRPTLLWGAAPILFVLMTTTHSLFSAPENPAGEVRITSSDTKVVLENDLVALEFDLRSGTYAIENRVLRSRCLEEGYGEVGGVASNAPGVSRTWVTEPCRDGLGDGRALRVTVKAPGTPTAAFEFALYPAAPFVAMRVGLENTTNQVIQLKKMHPLAAAKVYEGENFTENWRVLDGNSSRFFTTVSEQPTLRSKNNLLATWGAHSHRRSLVVGGLSYADFGKEAELTRTGTALQLALSAVDPVGKRLDPGAVYWPQDRFYIDCVTADPFAALEGYGRAVQAAQQVRLNYYTFPTVCLWYTEVKKYSKFGVVNTSRGAVEEMERVAGSGFLRYSPVGIRLVPDYYGVNNMNGWWDDAHFRDAIPPSDKTGVGGGKLVPPYETMEKWASEVTRLGGIPFLYLQPTLRSQDFCEQFPDYMLYNEPNRPLPGPAPRMVRPEEDFGLYWESLFIHRYSYDYTDPGFLQHVRENVYPGFRKAGIRGLMFDYIEKGYLRFDGEAGPGFEDKYLTAGQAYLNIFRLAHDGLGDDCYINERMGPGYELAIGLAASERIARDNDMLLPSVLKLCGLRWYKNRVYTAYDTDAKNLALAVNRDDFRSIITMPYVVTGRLLLGTSFSQLTSDQIYDLARVFPFPAEARSARPVTAFVSDYPRVYDLELAPGWHQLCLYNEPDDPTRYSLSDKGGFWRKPDDPMIYRERKISVELGKPNVDGGLGLPPDKWYYVYDFWNDCLVGKVTGGGTLEQTLRPYETRILAVREALDHPQVISTNRHITQGYWDMVGPARWNEAERTLSGRSKVVGREPYRMIIATNGYKLVSERCPEGVKAVAEFTDRSNGTTRIALLSESNVEAEWSLTFEKP